MKIPRRLPRPDTFKYNLYRTIGCIRYPRRGLNFLRYKLNKLNPKVKHLPLLMDIEPNQSCNYSCPMCDPATLFNIKRKSMSFENFKRVIDEQHGLMEVKIQGVGEPLMNGEFLEMVDYALSRKLWVRTTLNGSLLQKRDAYKRLIDAGIHDINLSCDGSDQEIYEKLRKGGVWSNFQENSKLLNDYNKSKGAETRVRAWVVVQEGNKHQFLDFPKVFASLGFTEMCYSFAMHNYGRDGENAEATPFDLTEQDFEKVIALGAEHGIEVCFWQYPKFTRSRPCNIPFNRVYLTTDLHIVPCCYIANQEVVDMGSYEDFNKIWFDDYQSFRESHATPEAEMRSYCKQCYRSGHV